MHSITSRNTARLGSADERTLVDGGNWRSRGSPFVSAAFLYVSVLSTSPKRLSKVKLSLITTNFSENRLPRGETNKSSRKLQWVNLRILASADCSPRPGHPSCCNKPNDLSRGEFRRDAIRNRHLALETKRFSEQHALIFHPASCRINYPTPLSTVRSVSSAYTIQCPPTQLSLSNTLRHISGNLNILLHLITALLNPIWANSIHAWFQTCAAN